MFSSSNNALLRSSFRKVVDAAFEAAAVQVHDGVEEVLFKPGIAGLHVLLEKCRSETKCTEVTEDIVSEEALEKAFDEKKWPHDSCRKLEDVVSLLKSLGIARSVEKHLPFHISELIDVIQEREETKQFPRLCTDYLIDNDERSVAQQSLGLAEMLDAVKVQSYIDSQRQKYFESHPHDPDTSIEEKPHVGL